MLPLVRRGVHIMRFYLVVILYLAATAEDILKMVPVKIFLNFGNPFCTLQLGFWKFLSTSVFLNYEVLTIKVFLQAFNPTQKSIGIPKFYRARIIDYLYLFKKLETKSKFMD